jgi:hypothetical protein
MIQITWCRAEGGTLPGFSIGGCKWWAKAYFSQGADPFCGAVLSQGLYLFSIELFFVLVTFGSAFAHNGGQKWVRVKHGGCQEAWVAAFNHSGVEAPDRTGCCNYAGDPEPWEAGPFRCH